MPIPDGYLSTSEAAVALGCSSDKVRQMHESGELAGRRGAQPLRPRVYIRCDDLGRPLSPDGRPVGGPSLHTRIDDLSRRLEAIENQRSDPPDVERFRDAALLQQAVIERLQRAHDLQSQAARELADALAEQARVTSTLLVDDPQVLLSSDGK